MNKQHGEDAHVVSAKDMTVEQLTAIEEKAIERFKRMKAINTNAGNIALAFAALVTEICSEVVTDTRVYIIAIDDMRDILKSYLKRHKLTQFPYKNAQLLDYALHADLSLMAAFVG